MPANLSFHPFPIESDQVSYLMSKITFTLLINNPHLNSIWSFHLPSIPNSGLLSFPSNSLSFKPSKCLSHYYALLLDDLQESWSPTGKPVPAHRSAFRHAGVVPKNHTHLRQGFGGSSASERNPPKHGRSVAERVPIRRYAFLNGQGRGLLRKRMKICIVRPALPPLCSRRHAC